MDHKLNRKQLYLLLAILILPMFLFVNSVYSGYTQEMIDESAASINNYVHFYPSDLNILHKKVTDNELKSSPIEVEVNARLVALRGEVILHAPTGKKAVVFDEPEVVAGSVIITGPDGMAELIWPDGSRILMDSDTRLAVEEAWAEPIASEAGPEGLMSNNLFIEQNVINLIGDKDLKLCYVSLVLEMGKIYGSLVPLENNEVDLLYNDSNRKVRMKVKMPWGVAGIRGTVWMNALTGSGEVTSVLSGAVEVSAAGVSTLIKPGQSVIVGAEGLPPGEPVDITSDAITDWRGVIGWVDQVIMHEKTFDSNIIDRFEGDSTQSNQDSASAGINEPTTGLFGNDTGNDWSPPGLNNDQGNSGMPPGLSGDFPGNSGNAPGLSGSSPGKSGSAPGLSGGSPGNSGSAPGLSGSSPGNSGSAPGQSGGSPGKSGSAPGLNR
jgi:hypothetical protein